MSEAKKVMLATQMAGEFAQTSGMNDDLNNQGGMNG